MEIPNALNPNLPAKKARFSRFKFHASWFLLLVVVVAIIGLCFLKQLWQEVSRDKYFQAVHLTNGQVFFGKLNSWNREQVLLTQVYYLQNTQAAQTDQNTNTTAESQFSLVKLGNELHGPLDRVYIYRKQIVYTEDLKNDSQVVKAILQNQQQP
ncbi:hypothetical protein C4546_00260 [Candidatus Parcubacteria bacterium]|jgi:hypothetical protein|nr:MAG: hypothetical protein C4546_00260 [Candidatus Parcubacteria bacterium]